MTYGARSTKTRVSVPARRWNTDISILSSAPESSYRDPNKPDRQTEDRDRGNTAGSLDGRWSGIEISHRFFYQLWMSISFWHLEIALQTNERFEAGYGKYTPYTGYLNNEKLAFTRRLYFPVIISGHTVFLAWRFNCENCGLKKLSL